MTAPVPAGDPGALLDRLEALITPPGRSCEWCMAQPGEWCISDCASPSRRCCPEYVAEYAADNGASSDEDATLIIEALTALPTLIRLAREGAALRDAVLGLAGRWEDFAATRLTGLDQRHMRAAATDLRRLVADTTGEK